MNDIFDAIGRGFAVLAMLMVGGCSTVMLFELGPSQGFDPWGTLMGLGILVGLAYLIGRRTG